MKKVWLAALLLVCALILTGCEVKPDPEVEAQRAYWHFLDGDLSLFDEEELEKWGLEEWMPLVLKPKEVEHTYLDLDEDGVPELLLRRVEDPAGYNAVFHYQDGKLVCWQNDGSEGCCWDYPLEDGTMVRQYEADGSSSYTLFLYRSDGSEEIVGSLYVREGDDPCYQVNGEDVDETIFWEELESRVTGRVLDRYEWQGAW